MRHDGSVSKAEERSRIRGVRRGVSPEARGAAAAGLASRVETLCHSLNPEGPLACAAYASTATEPPTEQIIAALHSAGATLLLPRIAGDRLDWVRCTRETVMAPGPMGILEPVGPSVDASALDSLDLWLVPALAVDASGLRLGQGGGYYDRALASVARHSAGGPLIVAVVFDDEVLDRVPAEPHDRHVDAVVTPTQVRVF